MFDNGVISLHRTQVSVMTNSTAFIVKNNICIVRSQGKTIFRLDLNTNQILKPLSEENNRIVTKYIQELQDKKKQQQLD